MKNSMVTSAIKPILALALSIFAFTIAAQENNSTAGESAMLNSAWKNYYNTLEEMRELTEKSARFVSHAEQRGEAYDALMEAQAMAYNFIMAPQQSVPRVYKHTSWSTNLFTLGMPTPTGIYSFMLLDGRSTYKLTGNTGDLKIMLMQVFNNVFGQPGADTVGNYDFEDFATKQDGSFDIIISAKKHEGNWVPLEPGVKYQFVMLRRFYGDWNDDLGSLHVEKIAGPDLRDDQSPEAIAERINLAAGVVRTLVKGFNVDLYDRYIEGAGGKNKFWELAGKSSTELIGSPSTTYDNAVIDIEPDEAAIIEWDVPNAAYWDFQIGDVWCRALDVMYQTGISMDQASIDKDGKVRVVVSVEDPGVPNWLDPMGMTEVIVLTRNYKETGPHINPPTVNIVKFTELRKHLPKETPVVSAEQRQKALEYRRQSYKKLYDS